MNKALDVITFGESMVLFNPGEKGPLRHIHQFTKSIAGAESNVAIALSRLGIKVGWFSKVGNDEFGRYIQFMIRGEDVDVSRTRISEDKPTGLLFKELFEHVDPNVYYYRKNSAASSLTPDDLDENYLRQAKILHLTGITPAISDSARQAVFKAIDIVKSAGGLISFDPNIRLKLWSIDEAKPVLLDLCQSADIIFPGIDEGELLLDSNDPQTIIKAFHDMGAKLVALKLGKEGCMVSNKQDILTVKGYPVEKVEDTVGAGDGFAAGFLASYLKGYSLRDCGDFANGVGAMATLVKGDSEGFPTMNQLLSFTNKVTHIDR